MPRPDPAAEKLVPANAEQRYEVTRADLPLACPMPAVALCDAPPRGAPAVEARGPPRCPCCRAVDLLKD